MLFCISLRECPARAPNNNYKTSSWYRFKIDHSWVLCYSVSLFASAPHEHRRTTTHKQLISIQNWPLVSPLLFCISLRECPAQALKNNYTLWILSNDILSNDLRLIINFFANYVVALLLHLLLVVCASSCKWLHFLPWVQLGLWYLVPLYWLVKARQKILEFGVWRQKLPVEFGVKKSFSNLSLSSSSPW